MSTSGAWTPHEVITIVGSIAGVIAVALGLCTWTNRLQRKRIEAFSEQTGWALVPEAVAPTKATLEMMLPDLFINPTSVMEVETGSKHILLADGSYSQRRGNRGVYLTTICLIESGQVRQIEAPVYISARWWLDAKILPDQVDVGDSEFAREFIVQSKDPTGASGLLTPLVQEALLAYARSPISTSFQVAFDTGRVAVLTGCITKADAWYALVDFARELEVQ